MSLLRDRNILIPGTVERVMRPAFRLLLVLAACSAYLGGAVPGRAACAPPTVEISQRRATAGDDILVTGRSWMSGCDDTPESGGCGASDQSAPVQDIVVSLKGPKTDQTRSQLNVGEIGPTRFDVELTTVDADPTGGFTAIVEIPDVPSGVYFLTAEGDLPAYQPPQIIVTADSANASPAADVQD